MYLLQESVIHDKRYMVVIQSFGFKLTNCNSEMKLVRYIFVDRSISKWLFSSSITFL